MHSQNMKLILFCAIFAIISFASAGINTWGFNSAGELGSGNSTIGKTITKPSPINGTLLKTENIRDICCGENFCVALVSSGAMYSWGDNTVGQLGDLSGVNQASPVRVKTKERVRSISCGQGHVLAVTSDSKVLAWGWNYRGQVADSMDKNVVPAPQRIKFFDQDQEIIEVAAGYQHSMAMTAHGIVYTWGDNSMGQLGTGKNDEQPFSNVPQMVKKLSGPSYIIGAGEDHSFTATLSGEGAVFAWGDNSVGQLGTGSISEQPVYLPVLVNVTNMMNHGTGLSIIIGGAAHTLAITNNNELFVWGGNSFGQLGLGDQIDRWVPTLLRLPNGKKIRDVAGGLLHSLVADSDGNVWAFGGNATGQLGDGDQQDSNSPVKTSVTSASIVTAGKFFSASLD